MARGSRTRIADAIRRRSIPASVALALGALASGPGATSAVAESAGAGQNAPDPRIKALERGDDCVFISRVHDFQPLTRDKVIVWTSARREGYLMQLGFPLSDLKFAHRLAFVDRNNDGRVCGFGLDRVIVADSSFRQPSTIMGMKRLDADSLSALEQQYDVRLQRGKRAAPDEQAPGAPSAPEAEQDESR